MNAALKAAGVPQLSGPQVLVLAGSLAVWLEKVRAEGYEQALDDAGRVQYGTIKSAVGNPLKALLRRVQEERDQQAGMASGGVVAGTRVRDAVSGRDLGSAD